MKNQTNTPNTKKSALQKTHKQTYQLESHRFAHYQPQPILNMSDPTSDGKLIAIARANASIEIWLRETWSQLLVVPGNKNAPARNLFWFERGEETQVDTNILYFGGKKRRLISTGLNG